LRGRDAKVEAIRRCEPKFVKELRDVEVTGPDLVQRGIAIEDELVGSRSRHL
jgi:hypothetical protein